MSVNWHRKDKVGGTGVLSGDCTSSDTKPTTVTVGSTLIETDTGNKFEFRGSTAGWVQTSFGGAVGVSARNTSAWVWPETWYLNGSASGATQTDNTEIYESNDISMYNQHVIHNTSSTDPVDVYVSLDGTNYLAGASAVRLHDATASATHVVTIPAGDAGILLGKYKKIKVLKDGATAETPSIRYSHSVV